MRISFQGLQNVGPFVGETCCWNMSGHMQGEGEKASGQKSEFMPSIEACHKRWFWNHSFRANGALGKRLGHEKDLILLEHLKPSQSHITRQNSSNGHAQDFGSVRISGDRVGE